jgi:hypothetical protein
MDEVTVQEWRPEYGVVYRNTVESVLNLSGGTWCGECNIIIYPPVALYHRLLHYQTPTSAQLARRVLLQYEARLFGERVDPYA